MAYKKLVDISYHNGTVDFKKLKAAGVAGVILRAGYGSRNVDSKFRENIKKAADAGLYIGVYWFSYAYTEKMAKAEAEKCLEVIEPYKKSITLPVFFDWEYDSMEYAKRHDIRPNKSSITKMNKVFCQAVKKAGYKAGFYFNKDYAENYIDVSALKEFVTWYARYTSSKQTAYDIWQYTEAGHISGVSGSFDLNYLINGKLIPASKSSKKSVTTIAKEVIAGKWGNGETRKRKLEAAGYDYAKVQAKVNELLK